MVLNLDLETLKPKVETLYTYNILAASWHLLLFTIICIVSTEQDILHIVQIASTFLFILLVLTRKYVEPKDLAYYLGLFFFAIITFGIGVWLAVTYNRENILPIVLSTAHSGVPLGDNELNSNTCDGVIYKEFRSWMNCLRDKYDCDTDACVAYQVDKDNYIPLQMSDDIPTFVLRKATTDVFSDGMYTWWGVTLFTIITAGFHLILALSADDYGYILDKDKELEKGVSIMPPNKWFIAVPYIQWINNGIQPMRWAEYSITASLMIVLVFIINGVTDIYLLAFSYIIMNLVNSFGAAIDYTNSVQIVAWFWTCAVGALIWQFALLLAAYSENISPYTEADNKELWQDYFGFTPWLNWIVILTYSGFGITNIIHQYIRFDGCCRRINRKNIKTGLEDDPTWDKQCCGCYRTNDIIKQDKQAEIMFTVEKYYIVQSFVSKTLLCTLVLIASVQRL